MTTGPPATHGRQEGLFLFIVSGTLFAGHRGSCAVAPTHCRQRAFWKPGQGRCRVCLRELSLGCRIGRFVAVTVWLTSAHKRDQARCLSWAKSAVLTIGRSLPVYPDKQTYSESAGMSQTCQQQTCKSTLAPLLGIGAEGCFAQLPFRGSSLRGMGTHCSTALARAWTLAGLAASARGLPR
jgi:hypothetical protein